jgi:hypothetical protein
LRRILPVLVIEPRPGLEVLPHLFNIKFVCIRDFYFEWNALLFPLQ